MATPISIANIARVAVGVVASIWALLGLGDALAAATAHGVDALGAAAIVLNVALIVGAVMTFANVRSWRAVVITSMVAVTLDRMLYVLGTGDYWLAASSAAMLAAVIGIAAVARTA
jgi:hypothetical protein